jgi:hypothetical protein
MDHLTKFEWITISIAFAMCVSMINYQYRRLWYLRRQREDKIHYLKFREDNREL